MRRALLPLLALAVLAGAIAFLFSGGGDEPETGQGTSEEQPERPEAGALEPGQDQPPRPGDGIVGRSETDPSPAADPQGAIAGPQLTVRVVRKDTREPVAQARVLLLEPNQAEEQVIAEAFFSGTSPDGLFERFGSERNADARGEARVPRPKEMALLAAAKEDSYGLTMWRATESQGETVEIEVEPDPPVRIRVRDERGLGVAGVPVAIRIGDGGAFSFDLARTSTGADGLAELRHVRDFARVVMGMESASVLAAIATLLREPVAVPFDFGALPAEPIELVLPPTGTVRVRLLDAAGAPHRKPQLVALSQARENPEDDDDFLAPGMPGFGAAAVVAQDGVAVFPHVGLSLPLQAAAQFPDAPMASTAAADGPQQAGETVEIELRQSLDYPVFVAQLTAGGAPLASRSLQAIVWRSSEGQDWEETLSVKTDAEGRVRFGVMLRDDPAVRVEWRLPAQDGQPALTGESRIGRFGAGENDLGVVALELMPLLASGVVVGPNGAPIAQANVVPMIMRKWGDEASQVYWEGDWKLRVSTDASGAFQIHGTWQEPTLRIQAQAPGLRETQVDAVPGATGLLLKLGEAAAVEGRVLVDEGVDINALYFELRVDGLPEDDPGARIGAGVQNDGRFRFEGLAPGFGTFRARLAQGFHEEEPLVEIAGVQLGGPPDPRLNPLDLRGLLHGLRIQAVGEGGVKLQEVQAWPAGEEMRLVQGWEGKVSLISREPIGEVVVYAPGWRETRVTATQAVVEVVLRRGIEVTIAVNPAEVRYGGMRLGCFLVPEVEGNSWARGGRSPFDDSGAATVLVGGPGPHRVEFLLTEDEKAPEDSPSWWNFTWVPRDDSEAQRVTILEGGGRQSFRVAPPSAESLARALEQVRGDD